MDSYRNLHKWYVPRAWRLCQWQFVKSRSMSPRSPAVELLLNIRRFPLPGPIGDIAMASVDIQQQSSARDKRILE